MLPALISDAPPLAEMLGVVRVIVRPSVFREEFRAIEVAPGPTIAEIIQQAETKSANLRTELSG